MAGRRQMDGLAHVIKQIGYHPDYLKEFLFTQSYLLNGDGPLRYDYRHYIAIMAAARHQCTCVMNYYKQKFTAHGGNVQWLKGLQFIPKKLLNLNEINKILAHTPWLLKKSHIESLTKGKDNWSIGELCQALVLLAHFHCLCSFVFASEILPLLEDTQETENNNSAVADGNIFEEVAQETVEELMEKMTILQKEKESSGEEQKNGNTVDLPSTLDAQFECDMEKFVDDDLSFTRRAFSSADGNISDFFIQDCTWDDHAYSLLNRFYNDVGTILDKKFKVAYDLTYYTMGHKENVDTTIFRQAVWNYIHRIYGIIHDDYNYSEMENLLDYGFRSYVETVCFCPEKITKDAHDEIMRAFRHSEKVHVNLMVFEARLQAELLYALSAVMRYMT
ncbi:sestrin homolog [Caerostris extrusa]|uniref:Sestrin homolog n=1 Tax=Caerostris extrusa TaxID=172846 RepID=A0AAV4UKV6_CAEEX|nr:sestrin homolog [Caerostris extrusa]